MARATRSSLQQDKSPQKSLDSKKRKRISDSADEPAQKLQRTDAPPYAATIPIDHQHATQILHVLQMIDEQGLLDRVYPLEQSPSSATTYSLRTLLSNSQEHTLVTLRTAVQNLLPISVHPRAPTAAPAAQQQRFCDLALSLLDQASFHPVSLDIESLLPQEPADDDASSKFVASSSKRYALIQHLPGGDYWTSANLPLTTAPETGPADLKDLPTGHADLVAIFPTPSASTSTVSKLGDYARAYDGRPKHPPSKPVQRRVTCGSFLDYGPWATFAPSWVQDGREIGMRQMGEVYAQRAQRYREKLQARQQLPRRRWWRIRSPSSTRQWSCPPPPEPADYDVDALQDILAPDEIESLKAVLGSLELENAVQELLTRNRKALQRLGQLQVERLRYGITSASSLKEGDEEWDVAHSILNSLTLLASLRPRSSVHPAAPLVPPPAVLHALQCSLPRAPTSGWNGTLLPLTSVPANAPAAGRPAATALRDDSTVKVRPGVPAAPPPPPPAPTPRAERGQAATPRPGPAAVQGQGGQYRYNTGARTPLQPQQQGYYAAGNQVPYGYTAGGWYGSYGSATPTAAGTQVQAYAPAQTQGYGTFAAGSGTSTPVGKAVANTVLGKSVGMGQGAGQGQWAYSAAGTGTQTPPVLPAHLRSAAAGGGSFHTPS
ncbi:hypothetical protein MVEN_01928100 [Mycena venus]|uniref:Uncharacterized protein n=1 Tax=Mycena venus TaxID=2733690 RepID=A0A8H6XGS6_9AGAR|nr:hypothetical protein MVEN_01928100 [Mycena venus]